MIEKKPALLLIDFQKGFDEEEYWGGNRNNKEAEQNAALLVKRWRELNLPVFHIIHSSQNPESKLHKSHAGFAIKEEVKPLPSEPVLIKNVNSAFIGTDLQDRLERQRIHTLVVAGLTTNHCISTSVRMAGNFGFEVFLLSDATATFNRIGINGECFDADLIHHTSLASLKDEFASILTTSELLHEMET